ncbi:MAG: methyltransferase domain-containing protein [Mucilaginibacter sp.]|uniref:methyltransferase domain-containing protein n=1 Tax=Mucilaginibacter sp. TaxID=1882438 RepID=UPI00326344A4
METLQFLHSRIRSFQTEKKEKRLVDELLNPSLFRYDTAFDHLYPEHIQELSAMHWTPVDIAKKAGDFLSIPNTQVLDIGSGVGKFCLTAGFFHPETVFYGIEQREELYTFAEIAKQEIDLPNVHFIHGNLTELDFSSFDHFYFYNAFYENIEPDSRIDYSVRTSFELYDRYSRFVYQMLEKKPPETRLVTFHAEGTQIPLGYRLVDNSYSKVLKMWIKE